MSHLFDLSLQQITLSRIRDNCSIVLHIRQLIKEVTTTHLLVLSFPTEQANETSLKADLICIYVPTNNTACPMAMKKASC